MVYCERHPGKRKRATLESDPPRDTRMGWRRLSVGQGSHQASLPTTQKDNQSFPPMPYKLRSPLRTAPKGQTRALDCHTSQRATSLSNTGSKEGLDSFPIVCSGPRPGIQTHPPGRILDSRLRREWRVTGVPCYW
jgi:hypothetical protein